jgi:hypothetical protein
MTTASFVTFYQNGQQLHANKLNGLRFISFGRPVGKVGNADCFESVTIDMGGKRQRVVTEADFGGPVSIRIINRCGCSQWMGLCDSVAAVTSKA